MPTVRVERLPVQTFGLGVLGFDHLQIVFQSDCDSRAMQDSWFVIEGLRERDGAHTRLAVEGWHGGTTLSDANGGLTGRELAYRIGTSESRGARELARDGDAVTLWATLVSYATDIETQQFPYIAISLPASPMPTINSSSLIASLLHHAGIDLAATLPSGLRFSPGMTTLLGTSRDDRLATGESFTTLVGGEGYDTLAGSNDARSIDKLYGGTGDDTFHWSGGINVMHGGLPGLAYADDGIDTVDYSGVGEMRIDAAPPGEHHLHPDFVVRHAAGQDYLFSIEEIIWDGAHDHVTVGEGVGLALSPKRATLDLGSDTIAAYHGPQPSMFLLTAEGQFVRFLDFEAPHSITDGFLGLIEAVPFGPASGG